MNEILFFLDFSNKKREYHPVSYARTHRHVFIWKEREIVSLNETNWTNFCAYVEYNIMFLKSLIPYVHPSIHSFIHSLMLIDWLIDWCLSDFSHSFTLYWKDARYLSFTFFQFGVSIISSIIINNNQSIINSMNDYFINDNDLCMCMRVKTWDNSLKQTIWSWWLKSDWKKTNKKIKIKSQSFINKSSPQFNIQTCLMSLFRLD